MANENEAREWLLEQLKDIPSGYALCLIAVSPDGNSYQHSLSWGDWEKGGAAMATSMFYTLARVGDDVKEALATAELNTGAPPEGTPTQ